MHIIKIANAEKQISHSTEYKLQIEQLVRKTDLRTGTLIDRQTNAEGTAGLPKWNISRKIKSKCKML